MPHLIVPKSILNKTKRRDPWFLDDYTINPYSGCSFNCLYCYIRGSKYGIHMDKKLGIKQNAPALLDKQLATRAKKGQYGFIIVSSATDPYLHFEKEYKLTRQLLEIILKHRFPVHILTKSDLVMRDFDVLKEIARDGILPADLEGKAPAKTLLTFSFSTIDDEVGAVFEPGATPPSARLKALEAAVKEGFCAGVSLMPLLPFISDTSDSLHHMFGAFRSVGAHYVMPATLSLFGEDRSSGKTLMLWAIKKHYPELEEKYTRWFQASDALPAFYRRAFYKKIKELALAHQLADRIVTY